MAKTFYAFQKKKDFLICVDSDGCAMDTMDIKHIRCFGPCMIREWELEEWEDRLLNRWNSINLYTMTRGINRYKGLAAILKEIDQKYTEIDGLDTFVRWTENAKELSNRSLEAAIAQSEDAVCMRKALHWSKKVNACIEKLPIKDKKPFQGVPQALKAASEFADVAIVSSANREAVEEEWERCRLLDYVDILMAQDAGSKRDCIAKLLRQGKYSPEHVLMVGDAPGDREAAQTNGVYFFPILVGAEKSSWKELREKALALLRDERYAAYGAEKEEEFLKNLGA